MFELAIGKYTNSYKKTLEPFFTDDNRYAYRVGLDGEVDETCFIDGGKVYSDEREVLSDLALYAETAYDTGDKDAADYVAVLSAGLLRAITKSDAGNIGKVRYYAKPGIDMSGLVPSDAERLTREQMEERLTAIITGAEGPQ